MHWSEFCDGCNELKHMTFGMLEYEADGYITRTWKCDLCGAYGLDRYSVVERERHDDNA